jgi:hypothetical protein
LEVSAVVRTLSAVAALAVAAAVFLVRRDRRRLRRQLVVEQLMAGCAHRDNAALAQQLVEIHRRFEPVLAGRQVEAAAELVVDNALSAYDSQIPPTEGGPK